MSRKQYQAVLLLISLQISACFPAALFARSETPAVSVGSPTSSVAPELRQKFLKQKQKLQSLGNPEEYKNIEVQWDTTKRRPIEVRNIHKKASKDIVGDTKKIISDFAPLYGTTPATTPELRLEKADTSKTTGERHVRINQFHKGLEMVGDELISHVDKSGFVYQIDGSTDNVPTLSTTPAISSADALAIGEKEHSAKAHFRIVKSPELVLYKHASAYILAYRYSISYDDPVVHMGQWIYYIDAQTGKKINAYNRVNDAYIPRTLSGATLLNEGGTIRNFTGAYSTVSFKNYMYDPSSLSGSYAVYNTSSNTGMYTDAGYLANRTGTDWSTTDRTEVSAAYNIAQTFQYYNALGFGVPNIAFSATGQTYFPVYTHYGNSYNNAFWNPKDGLYLGDGDGLNMKPLAVLDVMAHEFWHAWTENTSDLVYQDEPGALNESFSDISWVSVELIAQQSAKNLYPSTVAWQADWFIGEDAMIGTTALRDLRNPANTTVVGPGNEQPTKYHGTHWYFGSLDNGGVHQNSSIQNFFYYLLTEGGSGNNDGILYSVDGIGIEAARRIAFETNTHFVKSTTDYKGVRQAWIDAAASINPSYVPSVKAAWNAVGVLGNPIVPLANSLESFENDTNLPAGYSTSLLAGSGALWSVTTSTGALGSNSLVSGAMANSTATSVSYVANTDAGYMTFYWRTSSEATYDTLDFYVDGVRRNSWSGINPWSFYSDAVTTGSHTFTWVYDKDVSTSAGLDQVGIDAVHVVSLTGALSYGSDTGTGYYLSSAGLYGAFYASGAYDYIVSRSDGQMAKGSASGNLSFPLSGMLEWTGSMNFQYRDSNGFLSPIFTKSFFLDSVAPTAAQITSPIAWSLFNTGNISISWNPSSDTGAGLATTPYEYLVSDRADFSNIVTSGSVISLSASVSLADGSYFEKIRTYDLAGNLATSSTVSFSIDTTAPLAPVNVIVNHNDIIDVDSQTGVLVTGSGGISESGSLVDFSITDGVATPVSATGLVGPSGSFSLPFINVSSLADGMLNYSLDMTDRAGNRGPLAFGSIGKSVVPAAGTLMFSSGAYSNTGSVLLYVSAAKPVTYSISGSGIIESLTGTLLASGSVVLPVSLTPGDGNKTAQVLFMDEASAVSFAVASIILDTTPPTLSIASHASGAQVTGSSVLITGSVFDLNGITSADLNASPLLTPASWSKSMSIVGGNNTITLTATDNAGNISTLPITITRIVAISNITSSLLPSGVQVDFDTDLLSTGSIDYGTNSGALSSNQNATTSNGYHQSIVLTGLTEASLYYYTLRGVSPLYPSSTSSLGSFYTLKTVDIADNSATIMSTGAVIFSGAVNTGSTVFQGTGQLVIASSVVPTDSVSLSLSGLIITTTGTGTWNGIFEAPKVTLLTGAVLSDSGYALTGSIHKAGNDGVSLSLSGQNATLQVFVWNAFNGKVLHVYRSDSGPLFSPIDFCVVSLGLCRFETNHFSYFAFGAPNDSTPDSFSFTSQNGIERSMNADSNMITIGGTNTPSIISISGGMYSVNSLAYTAATGSVSSGDTIKIRLLSSASYSTLSQATVTIGGVSATFSVTTKTAPTSSGWGGGGWGGLMKDVCPSGDNSGSYYDGKCDGTTTQIVPSIVAASSSSKGFLASNPIIGTYDFTKDERIPQKVAAELNFFVTKLVKILDAKSGQNDIKKQVYYQAIAKYMLQRAKKSNNKREKRIFAYLYTRFLVVTKIEVK